MTFDSRSPPVRPFTRCVLGVGGKGNATTPPAVSMPGWHVVEVLGGEPWPADPDYRGWSFVMERDTDSPRAETSAEEMTG